MIITEFGFIEIAESTLVRQMCVCVCVCVYVCVCVCTHGYNFSKRSGLVVKDTLQQKLLIQL